MILTTFEQMFVLTRDRARCGPVDNGRGEPSGPCKSTLCATPLSGDVVVLTQASNTNGGTYIRGYLLGIQHAWPPGFLDSGS
jgi:hypothetical protein